MDIPSWLTPKDPIQSFIQGASLAESKKQSQRADKALAINEAQEKRAQEESPIKMQMLRNQAELIAANTRFELDNFTRKTQQQKYLADFNSIGLEPDPVKRVNLYQQFSVQHPEFSKEISDEVAKLRSHGEETLKSISDNSEALKTSIGFDKEGNPYSKLPGVTVDRIMAQINVATKKEGVTEELQKAKIDLATATGEAKLSKIAIDALVAQNAAQKIQIDMSKEERLAKDAELKRWVDILTDKYSSPEDQAMARKGLGIPTDEEGMMGWKKKTRKLLMQQIDALEAKIFSKTREIQNTKRKWHDVGKRNEEVELEELQKQKRALIGDMNYLMESEEKEAPPKAAAPLVSKSAHDLSPQKKMTTDPIEGGVYIDPENGKMFKVVNGEQVWIQNNTK